MPIFKDQENRTWIVSITILDVKRLREHVGVRLTDSDSLSELFDDESQQYEVMWYLVEAQARKLGVDEVAFATVFTENFAVATKALVEAIQLFFRQTGRPELESLISKILGASTRLRGVVEKNLSSERFDQVLDKLVVDEEARIDAAMAKALETKTVTS